MAASGLGNFLQTSVVRAWGSGLTVGKAWPGLEDLLSCQSPRLSPFSACCTLFLEPRS